MHFGMTLFSFFLLSFFLLKLETVALIVRNVISEPSSNTGQSPWERHEYISSLFSYKL